MTCRKVSSYSEARARLQAAWKIHNSPLSDLLGELKQWSESKPVDSGDDSGDARLLRAYLRWSEFDK